MNISVPKDYFDIEGIAASGQCFRMTRLDDNKVEVIANGRYLIVSSNGNDISFECDEKEFNEIWKHYFDIDSTTDYDKIIKSIDENDLYLRNAAKYGDGIRILNQDLWEMIISFLISQRNNIKRIRGCIKKLCEKYGEKKTAILNDGKEVTFFDFPTPEALAMAVKQGIIAVIRLTLEA